MTTGQRVWIEPLNDPRVSPQTRASALTLEGANYPLTARVFGVRKPAYAYYTFAIADYVSTPVAWLYWAAAADSGTVTWSVAVSALNTSTPGRVIDKAFDAENVASAASVVAAYAMRVQTITLTNDDTATNGSLVTLRVTRDLSDLSAAADAFLLGCSLVYTGA